MIILNIHKSKSIFNINPLVHGRFSRPITHIENGFKEFLNIHIAYPYFFFKFPVLSVLGLKRPQNLTFFINVKTKIFNFQYFPKSPSEMNSTHPFCPILIPNPPYVIFYFSSFCL